jgi:hypothetical protein
MWYFIKVTDGWAKPSRLVSYVEADSEDEAVTRGTIASSGFKVTSADDKKVLDVNEVTSPEAIAKLDAMSDHPETYDRLRFAGTRVVPKNQ